MYFKNEVVAELPYLLVLKKITTSILFVCNNNIVCNNSMFFGRGKVGRKIKNFCCGPATETDI